MNEFLCGGSSSGGSLSGKEIYRKYLLKNLFGILFHNPGTEANIGHGGVTPSYIENKVLKISHRAIALYTERMGQAPLVLAGYNTRVAKLGKRSPNEEIVVYST